jgi:hypothetical protein
MLDDVLDDAPSPCCNAGAMEDQERTAEDPDLSPKKPYVKPSYRFEQVFVTSALSCGKISGSQPQCEHVASAS